MKISEELRNEVFERYKTVCDDKDANLAEFLALDVFVTGLKLESLRELALAGDKDKAKLIAAVEGLLKVIFEQDVSKDNIGDRFNVMKNELDSLLLAGFSSHSTPNPMDDPAVCIHIQFAQRILIAWIGRHINILSRRWLSHFSALPDIRLIRFHDGLLRLISYMRMIPHIVMLRSMATLTVIDNDLDVSPEKFLFHRDAGTGRITIDLLQPKETLMAAFEQYVDTAKAKMRENAGNQMMANLYDFCRKKDGRREKSLYRDWYNAIIEFEDYEGYASSRQAAEEMAGDEEDPDSVRRTMDNRLKRFYSLVEAVMENRFPRLG